MGGWDDQGKEKELVCVIKSISVAVYTATHCKQGHISISSRIKMEISPGPLALTASKNRTFTQFRCFMLLHCTVDSLGKTIRSVPAGHEPKLHGQKSDKRSMRKLASWMQLDVANITGRFKTQTLVFIRKPSWWQGAAPMHASRSQKNKNPCRQMRNQSDFLKSMCVSGIANSWYLEASESNLYRWSFGGHGGLCNSWDDEIC